MGALKQQFVLLDRDGVINRRVRGGYVTSWDDFEFLPRALDALRLFAENGYATMVISNQACVGKGLLSASGLDAITRRLLLEVALSGGNISQIYYCPHTEQDGCSCRKPKPGLIERARTEHSFLPEETFLVGDSVSDQIAAEAAGCSSILIQRDAFLHSRNGESKLRNVATSLYEAAEMILASQHVLAGAQYRH
ncbi:MAG TPA: HAD family hydrolase [Candidatus Acidoferrum sp.]|jgi:D-glycero-D-manno-heptose 1,7-bisphosphate phosphatase